MVNDEVFLIAEIGINHNGNFNLAKSLILEASNAGADAVKFQYRNLSRTYGSEVIEIGDEILKSEIQRNFISVDEIISLTNYAKSLFLKVGISFFDQIDIEDFGQDISNFDFFKIPSVEMSNLDLIFALLSKDKMVYVSTGAHNEEEIESIFNLLPEAGWLPLHCVSNYPVLNLNSKIGYLEYMRQKWGREVGYSSHDKDWEVCLFAMAFGAKVIERHITLDKDSEGLDHTTSSTPEEFKKISAYLRSSSAILTGNAPRSANQGELINRQNLGKSFFALRDISAGEIISTEDFIYRHPNTGLSRNQFTRKIGIPLKRPISTGQVLTESHFSTPPVVPEDTVLINNRLSISLPVRFHDYKRISETFRLDNYELHLSYGDLEKLEEFEPLSDSHKISIHLPDYLNSSHLINPFSKTLEIKNRSLATFEKVATFGKRLAKHQQNDVTFVTSLSIIDHDKEGFYSNCKKLQDDFSDQGLTLSFQWLPPFAWYFGGSEPLKAFNSEEDLEHIIKNDLNICLDTSHLLMGANYFSFDPFRILEVLENRIRHFHLADARGFDGEGYHIGRGEEAHLPFLLNVIKRPQVKVVEVWQGHLNLYSGFHLALESIAKEFSDA